MSPLHRAHSLVSMVSAASAGSCDSLRARDSLHTRGWFGARAPVAWCCGLVLAACGPSGAAAPDAPVSTVPTSPAGTFAVTSTFDVPVPAVAAPVITTLTDATDGPDDPSRYLLDRMIASLPDGTVKTIAAQAGPYVAAYLNTKLATVAPNLVSGIDQLASRLDRIATHFGTTETWVIDDAGNATRTITGLQFDLGGPMTTVRFADAGRADLVIDTHVAFDAGARLAIGDHMHALPYGAWLRLGLDLAVIPGVVPAAHDLGAALAALLDCDQLGTLIAGEIGLGAPALYATACRTAMTLLASELDGKLAALDAAPMTLEVVGVANGVDTDGDGTMDQLAAGSWTGTLHGAGATGATGAPGPDEPISGASFTGQKPAAITQLE
jgi:hypothetical protein